MHTPHLGSRAGAPADRQDHDRQLDPSEPAPPGWIATSISSAGCARPAAPHCGSSNRPAWEFFETLSYTHRKEWVCWVEEAKKAETRSPRIAKTVAVVDDLDAVVASWQAHDAELVGEVERYEDSYRLCYVRGRRGIIFELAEQLGQGLRPAADRLASISDRPHVSDLSLAPGSGSDQRGPTRPRT